MTKSARLVVILAALVLCVVAALVAVRLATNPRGLRETARVIRRRAASPVAEPPDGAPRPAVPRNLAPLATVSVSSIQENSRFGEGVADGVVDSREWVAQEETSGAWIRLDWEAPVVVVEIELYDRPSPVENVLGGTLTFDDGSMIAVPSLPPDGSPWRVNFPPKSVRWILFRIDRAQGSSSGLAEIMVYGTVNP